MIEYDSTKSIIPVASDVYSLLEDIVNWNEDYSSTNHKLRAKQILQMREDSIRIVCDICGKKSQWVKNNNTSAPTEVPEELKSWKVFDLKGPAWIEGSKHYCSKECVIKDLDSLYDQKQEKDT